MPYSLKDQMNDEFNHIEKGFITVMEYEALFHSLSRYFYATISTESKSIQKFVKGFNFSL